MLTYNPTAKTITETRYLTDGRRCPWSSGRRPSRPACCSRNVVPDPTQQEQRERRLRVPLLRLRPGERGRGPQARRRARQPRGGRHRPHRPGRPRLRHARRCRHGRRRPPSPPARSRCTTRCTSAPPIPTTQRPIPHASDPPPNQAPRRRRRGPLDGPRDHDHDRDRDVRGRGLRGRQRRSADRPQLAGPQGRLRGRRVGPELLPVPPQRGQRLLAEVRQRARAERDRAQPGQPEVGRRGRRTRGAGATSPAPRRSTRSSCCPRRARRSASRATRRRCSTPRRARSASASPAGRTRTRSCDARSSRPSAARASSTTCTSPHRETLDPEAYPTDKQVEATSKCGQEKLRSQRDQSFCQEITFPGFDALNGPAAHERRVPLGLRQPDARPHHGGPAGGRRQQDAPGWKQNPTRSDCSGSPVIKGVFKVGAKVLSPPPNERDAQGGRAERRPVPHGQDDHHVPVGRRHEDHERRQGLEQQVGGDAGQRRDLRRRGPRHLQQVRPARSRPTTPSRPGARRST